MRRLTLGAVVGIALLAACGGGGGGTASGPVPLPPGATSAPTSSPGPQTFTSSNAVAIPNAAPGSVTVPVALSSDATGASANAALPATAIVAADTTIAVTYTSAADSSLPALSTRRSVRDETKKNALAYLKLQFSADLTLPQAPGFTFTVPGTIATTGVNYWLAFYDPLRAAAGWQQGFEGPATVTPATVNGKSVTQFTFASNGQPLSFVANQPYWFAVIAIVSTAASPTPVPTTVPTNAPPSGPPAKVLSTPRNIQFSSITDAPVSLTFVQTGFAGNFELHGDCTGIVNTTGSSPTWTITPVGQGRCVIVGLGDRGSSAVVHIGVVTPYETPRPTPTGAPSHSPEPTHAPTTSPSHSPEPSESPEPTHPPTTAPTHSPTTPPTNPPTTGPTSSPSHSPEPTHSPTAAPTTPPSHSPQPTTSPGPTTPPNSKPSSSPSPNPSPSPGQV